jgi:hypothetical protein
VLKHVFHHGMEIKLGDWPDDFADITPGHNQHPKKPERFNNTPMIKIQRVGVLDEDSFFNSFDTVYNTNKHTRIFSKVLSGDLCSAPKQEEGTYTRGMPGCWWIVQSVLLKSAGLEITTPLDQEKVQEVNNTHIFSNMTTLIFFFLSDPVGTLCQKY